MLSNAYFLAKFRIDTAENEPAKNFQNFANFPGDLARLPLDVLRRRGRGRGAALRLGEGVPELAVDCEAAGAVVLELDA